MMNLSVSDIFNFIATYLEHTIHLELLIIELFIDLMP